MTKDEALALALEALENELAVDMTNLDEVDKAAQQMLEAIWAIKQALASPVQEPVATVKESLQVEQLLNDMLDTLPYNSPDYWIGRIKEVLALYTTTPAAPVQKPLFADIIAKHPGLVEELKAMDASPVQDEDLYDLAVKADNGGQP
jgi:hypothetical protein